MSSPRFVPRLDPSSAGAEHAAAVRATARRPIAELGVLGAIAAEESVTDIFVNGDGTVWCDRGAGNELVDRQPLSPAAARELAVRLIALGGRHLDESKPNF